MTTEPLGLGEFVILLVKSGIIAVVIVHLPAIPIVLVSLIVRWWDGLYRKSDWSEIEREQAKAGLPRIQIAEDRDWYTYAD